MLIAISASTSPYLPLLYFAAAAVIAPAVALLPRLRKPAGIISSIILVGVFILTGGHSMFRAYWWIPYGILLVLFQWLAMICLTRQSGAEFSAQMLIGFAIVHMAAAAFGRSAAFASASGLIWGVSVVYFVMCAFKLNELSVISYASLRKTGAPPSRIRTRNAVMIAILTVITVIFANLNHIGGALRQLIKYVIQGIIWLMSKLSSPAEPIPSGEGGGMGDLSGLAEATEPSMFAIIMEKILTVIALIILAAALCWLVVIIWRKASRFFKLIMQKLRGITDSLNQTYKDESESLLDWGEIKRAAGARIKRLSEPFIREREPKWDSLDNRAKVRYAVRASLKRKPNVPVSKTVHTLIDGGTLPVGSANAVRLAADYDVARYSSSEPDTAAAKNAAKALR
jgi:hypothetical protein